jgi:thiol-disulfide isomerase/thioredoxin
VNVAHFVEAVWLKKRRLALGAIAAASLIVAGVLACDIAWLVFPGAGPAMVGEPAVSPAPPALDLSVFDRPRALPEIRFADAQGRQLTLADFRGRVVLLNVWATWCAPCRKEMPTLDRLQAKLGGKDFVVVPLSIDRDGAAAVNRFYHQLGLKNLGTYVDSSGMASHALTLPGVPTTLLIDRDGREIARKMGPAEWDGAKMVALVKRTMERPADQAERR